MHFISIQDFEQWRTEARRLLSQDVPPHQVQWTTGVDQPSLFGREEDSNEESFSQKQVTVPTSYMQLARLVACHRDPIRWEILYRVLWRLTRGERHVMEISSDQDVFPLLQMRKAVTRDVHKMKAFVRFRRVGNSRGGENFIAWHRPDHTIVRLAAPFFARRFKAMNWTILTPHESVTWDQKDLHYGPGVPASEGPEGDELEELWRTYYASIFNPARVKVAMMKSEMPVRHWPTLPEASIIPQLLQDAPQRVQEMVDQSEGFEQTAAHFLPEANDLSSLRQAASVCTACHLHCHASQTVFGEGPPDARIVVIGEQPGDREDVEGRPFVGPAGQLLNRAFQQAGIEREHIYVTNVVKHFKFSEQTTARGKRRIHQKPDSREIFACRPWLEAEISAIRPDAMICLGATAAQALLGREFRLTQQRGKLVASDWCSRTVATWHPSAILRMRDKVRRSEMESQLADDLALVT